MYIYIYIYTKKRCTDTYYHDGQRQQWNKQQKGTRIAWGDPLAFGGQATSGYVQVKTSDSRSNLLQMIQLSDMKG